MMDNIILGEVFLPKVVFCHLPGNKYLPKNLRLPFPPLFLLPYLAWHTMTHAMAYGAVATAYDPGLISIRCRARLGRMPQRICLVLWHFWRNVLYLPSEQRNLINYAEENIVSFRQAGTI